MVRVRRSDVVVVGGIAAVTGAVVQWRRDPWIDWFFTTVMLVCLWYVARLSVAAWRGARAERLRADRLRALAPDAVAAAAVAEERHRLDEEIGRCLREALERVRGELVALAPGADPTPALLRIQEHTRWATSELRRQLGLLRREEEDPVIGRAPAAPAPPSARPARVRRRDVALGMGTAALAVAEASVYLPMELPGAWSPWSVVVSAVAALTITGWREAPAQSAAVCGGVFAFAGLVGTPVVGGFWLVATVGLLTWTLTAEVSRTRLTRLGTLVLVLGVGIGHWVADRDNFWFAQYVLAVALASGLVVRASRRRRTVDSSRAEQAALELEAATREAVRSERVGFARELHDTVSHAVGVIAVQAAAAEVSWPHDQPAVDRAVAVLAATTTRTLTELDRLLPDGRPPSHTVADLQELVARIGAGGTPVRFQMSGAPDPSVMALVYRVVQEALTNAVRHAPSAAVAVELRCGADRVHVEVRDDGPGPREGERRGYGLVGLAERVELAGGTMAAGPRPDGRGFRVAVELPAAVREAVR